MIKFLQRVLPKGFFVALSIILLSGFQDAVAQTFQQGDLFVAVGNGQVQWRRPGGSGATLIQTLTTGQGGFTTGMAFDAAGSLYVTNFSSNSISRFNTNGVVQGTFGSGYSTPESIVFDLAGNVYVGNLGNGVRKYNSSGTFLSTVVPGRIDFFDLGADQCTALYTQEGSTVIKHNACTNTALGNFATSLGGTAFALRIRQNGEVLLANGGNIRRLSAAGTILQTYDVSGENGWFGLNLNPDGTSFWSADFGTANVYKIDIATGNVLASFNTGTGGSTVFGLAVFGEFTVSVCADNVLPAFVAPSPACGATIQATVGVPLTFTVAASDANAGDVVTLNATGIPAGATTSPVLPTNGSPVSTVFNWTPTAANLGSNVVTFSAADKCGQATCTYTINVTAGNSNIYYSKSTGDLHNVLTWGLNPDGSGPNPPDFTDGKTFQLANRPGVYTMTANWTVGGIINIPIASELQIDGFTLSEAALDGPGILTGSLLSNLIITGVSGGDAGILKFSTSGNSLNNLTVDRTGASASATIGTGLNLYNILTITNGTLNTGGLLTLKSSVLNTARVAPVAATGTVSGNVIVERYIPARRAWRILSAPVTGAQTINGGWQEGAILGVSANPNPFPGYGTHITGGPTFGSTANGFDQNPGAASSIKVYNSTVNNWQLLQNTNVNTIGTIAYMTFIRGERGLPIGLNTVPPTNTTLRATGPLNIGDKAFIVNGAGFTAIANPYASPINFETITRSGVQNNFYLWDPKMGGLNGVGAYVLLSFNGTTYDVVPASVSPESQYIQSGQGFLVRPDVNGVAGSITIKESDKSATAATNVFRMNSNAQQQSIRQETIRITLKAMAQDNSEEVLDEAMTTYGSNYSNKIDNLDAAKLPNINENLGIVRNGGTYMVERREVIGTADTIHLSLSNTLQREYILGFTPANLPYTNLTAVLEDSYLQTSTDLDLSKAGAVKFSVTNDPASAKTNRFRIIIKLKGATDLVFEKKYMSAYPNPVSGTTVNILMGHQEEGTYRITLVNSAGQVVFRKNVQHAGGNATLKLPLGKKLIAGAYQLQVTGVDGTTNIPLISN